MDAKSGLKPVTRPVCFDAIYLRSLVRARILGIENRTVALLADKVTEGNLKELVCGTRQVFAKNALADVKRNISLDASEPIARIRILMLQTLYVELCKRRG